jgi:hypothetical protein
VCSATAWTMRARSSRCSGHRCQALSSDCQVDEGSTCRRPRSRLCAASAPGAASRRPSRLLLASPLRSHSVRRRYVSALRRRCSTKGRPTDSREGSSS